MDATFSPLTGMAYVSLTDAGDERAVDHTEPVIVDLPGGTRRLINLDFDADGRLIGIEVDGAADSLPRNLLARAAEPRGESRAAPAQPIPAWLPFPHLFRRPEGLDPLSQRPRDRATRWILFLAAVVMLVVVFGGLILVRQSVR